MNREYLGKTRVCRFCKEKYELDYYDNDITHNTYCGGDCQYFGEVLPDYIRESTGEEKKKFQAELNKKLDSMKN